MSPVVSIVLPAFDAAGVTRLVVASVWAQTMPSWDLIVVDDGSTDDTATQTQSAVAGDPRVRVICVVHGGIVPALNAGLATARGRFIARTDGDGEMMADRLAAQVSLLEMRREIGVAFSWDVAVTPAWHADTRSRSTG